MKIKCLIEESTSTIETYDGNEDGKSTKEDREDNRFKLLFTENCKNCGKEFVTDISFSLDFLSTLKAGKPSLYKVDLEKEKGERMLPV